MENKPAGKNNLGYSFTGFIMILLLSLPASAGTVLDIQVTESINLTDAYDGVTLTQGTSSGAGEINITNDLSTTALYDISLNFSEGDSSNWISFTSGVNLDTTGDGYVTVHINSLAEKGSAIINYDCTGSRPVVFSESYNTSKILAGGSVDVSLTLEKNASVTSINDITFIKTAVDTNDNGTSDFLFSSRIADVGSVVDESSPIITWTITELNGTTSSATLNFTAADNDTGAHSSGGIQSSMLHYLGNATLQFTINNGSESGSGVGLNEDPTATTSNIEISLQKEQLTSGDGGDGDDWGFTPTIDSIDTEIINFSVSSLTVYVTNTGDLNSTYATNDTYSPETISSSGSEWSGDRWNVMDFPDPVPVGWIDLDLSVDFSGSQLSEAYSTTNGTYELIEKVYIINGYLVEAKKSISENGTANQYDITLWVHNLGNLETPPNVYVYDIVPTNFSMVYNDMTPAGSTGITNPIAGAAYWWNVGPLEADGQDGDEATIHYTVQGTGLYRMTDLFILGIDPSYTQNMPSTPVLKTGTKIVSASGMKSVMNILMISSLLLGMVGLRRKKREN